MVISPTIEALDNPVVSGLLLGFLMIGPDHIGTLMSLSTLTTGLESLKVGMSWGFGHGIGMVLLVPPLLLLQGWTNTRQDWTADRWEYWGDYFIGASLIAVATYFFVYESSYIERTDDGTYVAVSCCCHGPHAGTEHNDSETAGDGSQHCSIHGPASMIIDQTETTPLIQDKSSEVSMENTWLTFDARDVQSVILGVFQGLCCPMAFMSLGFIGKLSGADLPTILLFIVVFLLTSALGSGALTFLWGLLSSQGLGSFVSPLYVYRAVNFFTFLLGVIWILANAFGMLHYVNYMHGMHESMHAGMPGMDMPGMDMPGMDMPGMDGGGGSLMSMR